MSVGLSEKLIAQPLTDASCLVLSQNEKTQRWQIDCADNQARSEEATSELMQKIAFLFQEVKEKGCAAFWTSQRQSMPAVQIQPAIVRKNLQSINLFFKQRVQNGQDYDALVDLLVQELEKQDYLGKIPTDLECVVGKGEKQRCFKAHRSLLCYFDYWAGAFDNNWSETHSGIINFPETDPDHFEKILEWIYTGTFSWEWSDKEVEGSEISAKIYELQQLAKTAQAFVLTELVEFCLVRVAQLSHFLKAVNELDLEAKTIQTIPVPPTYSDRPVPPQSRVNPANAKGFYDVIWTCDDKSQIPCNGPLLDVRSTLFSQLLASLSRELPAFVSSAFYKELILALHKGLSSKGLQQYITDQNVWDVLRFAHGKDKPLARFCSRKAFETFFTAKISPDQLHLIHSVSIGADWSEAKTEGLTQLPNLQEVHFDCVTTSYVQREVFVSLLLKNRVHLFKVFLLAKCPWVYDTIVHNIADVCPNLQVIDLSECHVDDEAIEKLASYCRHLERIYLSGCKKVSGASVESIAKNCPQLKVLTLTSFREITDQTLETLATHCPQLRELVLTYCTKVTAPVLAKLATRCPHLRVISLNGCTSFNDQVLDKLATHCPRLETLYVSHCKEITSAAIEKLVLHCPNMQFLNLSGSFAVTDKTVKMIAAHCRRLLSIRLNNCAGITDFSVEYLARLCPYLSEISLTGCINITNKGVEMLAAHSHHIQDVNLVGCTLITDSAIEKLLANCPKLRTCNLVGCEGLSRTILDKVEKTLKK